MLERIKKWFKSLFSTKKKPAKPKKRIRRKRTIGDTLKALDRNFSELRLATDRVSQIDYATKAALHRMGPFVPPPENETPKQLTKPNGAPWPGLVYVATNGNVGVDPDAEKKMISHFFAIKLDRLAGRIRPKGGMFYHVGACVPFDKRIWMETYCQITHDGEISIIPFKVAEFVSLPRGGGYWRPSWRKSLIPNECDADPEHYTKSMVVHCFNFWFMRQRMWNIGISRNNVRMNFSVHKRETKHYFKDRDRKGVCLETGKLRPIAHFVRGHTRVTGAMVRPHIRGVRQFYWNGYFCNVKAPGFVDESSFSFDVPSSEFDYNETPQGADINQVATVLGRIESKKQRNIFSRGTGAEIQQR